MNQKNHPNLLKEIQESKNKFEAHKIHISEELAQVLSKFQNVTDDQVKTEIANYIKYNKKVYDDYLKAYAQLSEKTKKLTPDANQPKTSEQHETLDTSKTYVKKYLHEKQLHADIDSAYKQIEKYKDATPHFRKVEEEDHAIFVSSGPHSKIFLKTANGLKDAGETLHGLYKIGDFYKSHPIKPSSNNDRKEADYSKSFIFDKKGNLIKQIDGDPFKDKNIDCYYVNSDNNRETYAIYDKDFNLIGNDFIGSVNIVSSDGENYLIQQIDTNAERDKRITWKILSSRKEQDTSAKTTAEIQEHPLYQKYLTEKHAQKATDQLREEQQRQAQEAEKFELDIEKDDNLIKKITDKEGNIIFSPDLDPQDKKLQWAYGDIYGYTIKDPENGLIIINGSSHSLPPQVKKSYFINAHTGTKISNEQHPGSMFIHGKTLANFITPHQAEIYTLDGELLGITARRSSFDRNNADIIETPDSKKLQLIDHKTASVHPQVFDKILNVYEESDQNIVIVENDGEIYEIIYPK